MILTFFGSGLCVNQEESMFDSKIKNKKNKIIKNE